MLFRHSPAQTERWKFSGYAHFTLFTSHDDVVVVGNCKLWNDKKILILTLSLRRGEWRPNVYELLGLARDEIENSQYPAFN